MRISVSYSIDEKVKQDIAKLANKSNQSASRIVEDLLRNHVNQLKSLGQWEELTQD